MSGIDEELKKWLQAVLADLCLHYFDLLDR
jgi:hypothetical protein